MFVYKVIDMDSDIKASISSKTEVLTVLEVHKKFFYITSATDRIVRKSIVLGKMMIHYIKYRATMIINVHVSYHSFLHVVTTSDRWQKLKR